MTRSIWRIRLGAEAERDFVSILRHSVEQFGDRQAAIYKALLIDALVRLEAGPEAPGSAARDEILPGLRSLHVSQRGRRGRHFILYRIGEERTIEVLRVLHDAMDIARHLPPRG